MTAKPATYRVLKSYATTLVRDGGGTPITLGFYEGALIENAVEDEHLDMLVESGYVEKVSASAAPKADDEGGKAGSAPAKSSK